MRKEKKCSLKPRLWRYRDRTVINYISWAPWSHFFGPMIEGRRRGGAIFTLATQGAFLHIWYLLGAQCNSVTHWLINFFVVNRKNINRTYLTECNLIDTQYIPFSCVKGNYRSFMDYEVNVWEIFFHG